MSTECTYILNQPKGNTAKTLNLCLYFTAFALSNHSPPDHVNKRQLLTQRAVLRVRDLQQQKRVGTRGVQGRALRLSLCAPPLFFPRGRPYIRLPPRTLSCSLDVPFPPRRTGRYRKGMMSAHPSYQGAVSAPLCLPTRQGWPDAQF